MILAYWGLFLCGTGQSDWLNIPRQIVSSIVLCSCWSLDGAPSSSSPSSLRSAPLPRSWGLLNQLQRVIKRLCCFVFFSFPFSFMFPFLPPALRVSLSTSDTLSSFFFPLLPLNLSFPTSLTLHSPSTTVFSLCHCPFLSHSVFISVSAVCFCLAA